MESQTSTREKESLNLREVPEADKTLGLDMAKGSAFCKMGEGWTCIITKTEGPDAGKVFVKCGENCTCTIEGEAVSQELNLPPDVVSSSGSGAFCKCGEGWSCVIFRTEGPDAGSGKGFAECAGQCSCTIDDKST
ncbi:hypothetical protein AAZX31_01G017600 [Glycine max]|uniref:Uncharacterized protein n=3 Tax=Glycine subgen. Soja TaxID=1462606 RepID=K7K1A8_SOYBN|nr:uncharacterized protein LOC100305951 [Glycine max]XP_028227766.1 uncharacterized protein LOC114408794 [Glycine soja]KAG5059141.1 hypothetical protein JHK87_000170 [Glycine soja]KAG5067788.1 hypothetical protein JHK85_000165 [Glycine max]KAG5087550.1 hypothetical protein JHK86_000162 [Glycine max]KAH1161179.1 hypothetical protein GYH30_000181 [Glycine max]KAH1264205.1 hypothetical protein GmHk_01G000169 [Glycine max]|eukprot:NP_001336609.1 uncharacterized protein LOC100305951 [Glycine max]